MRCPHSLEMAVMGLLIVGVGAGASEIRTPKGGLEQAVITTGRGAVLGWRGGWVNMGVSAEGGPRPGVVCGVEC